VKTIQGLVKTLPAVRKTEAAGASTDPHVVKTFPSAAKTFARREISVPYALKNSPVHGENVSRTTFLLPAEISAGQPGDVITIGDSILIDQS